MQASRAIKNIAVFAASRAGVNPAFNEAASKLGQLVAQNGYKAHFGGIFDGLMNEFARSVLNNGGSLTGYLPLNLQGYAKDQDVTGNYERLLVEATQDTRNAMKDKAGAFIALPGGYGSLAEIYDLTEAQYLHFYDAPQQLVKPVILYNVDGYYDGLSMQHQRAVHEGLISPAHKDIIRVANSIDDVQSILETPLKTAEEYTQEMA